MFNNLETEIPTYETTTLIAVEAGGGTHKKLDIIVSYNSLTSSVRFRADNGSNIQDFDTYKEAAEFYNSGK